MLKWLLAPLGLFLCLGVEAACPQIFEGVSYPCTVNAGVIDGPSGAITGEYKVGVEANEIFVHPRYNGVRKPFSAATNPIIFTSYPGNTQWGQFVIMIDTDLNTVTLHHVKDTSPDYKQDWSLANNTATGSGCTSGQWCLRVRFYDPSVPTVDEVVFTGTTDWRPAAQYYKDWAVGRTWYASHNKLAGRSLGFVIEAATTAFTYWDANLDTIPEQFGSRAVGVFMTQYRTDAFDVDYPDYTCSGAANCPAWFQSIKNIPNAFGLPYINGALWDTTNTGYLLSNMCLDSGGAATVYSGNLRLVDPLLSSWTTTLRTAFNALQATDGSTSAGVYIDVAFAHPAATCHYSSVADYDAWITGMKAVGAAFDDKIIMTESPGEIYLPYIDIAYMFPTSSVDDSSIGLFSFIYGDVPNLYIVGTDGNSTDSDSTVYRRQYQARNILGHDAGLLEGGVTLNAAIFANPTSVARSCLIAWSNTCPAAPRASASPRTAASARTAASTRAAR